jgi:hypothetical protein
MGFLRTLADTLEDENAPRLRDIIFLGKAGPMDHIRFAARHFEQRCLEEILAYANFVLHTRENP